MEVEISSNMKFFKLYPRGREAKSWDNIGAFQYVNLQLTIEIFLAPDHPGGVYNALVTQPKTHPWLLTKQTINVVHYEVLK
jgi:hypothetical protein